MDEHDEAFEAIPWDRFTTREARFDPRMAFVAIALVIAVGASAFAVRRTAAPVDVGTAPIVAPVPTATTTTSTPTLPPDLPGLWASPEVEPASGVAARFVLDLLEGSGAVVSSVLEVETRRDGGRTRVVVEALGSEADGTPIHLGMAVEITGDRTVVAWEPMQLEPLRVRPLVEGAVPPPEVLDQLARIVARWGSALQVVRSGIDGDRWWAEFLVALPGGTEVPLVVWEGQ